MSNKARFWIGVLLALPAMVLAGALVGAAVSAVDAVGADADVGLLVSVLVSLMLFAGYLALAVLPSTRWFALGMLAGAAVLFVLAAGACVVLLVALSNSYG
jgi:hypothetical protein